MPIYKQLVTGESGVDPLPVATVCVCFHGCAGLAVIGAPPGLTYLRGNTSNVLTRGGSYLQLFQKKGREKIAPKQKRYDT